MKGIKLRAENVGGYTIGMSFVVHMLTVATLVPALEPMYGTPSCTQYSNTGLQFKKLQSEALTQIQISVS